MADARKQSNEQSKETNRTITFNSKLHDIYSTHRPIVCRSFIHLPARTQTYLYNNIPLLGAPHPTKTTSACPGLASCKGVELIAARLVWKAERDTKAADCLRARESIMTRTVVVDDEKQVRKE
jgi:hypothetical protein